MSFSIMVERRNAEQRAIVASLQTHLQELSKGIFEALESHTSHGMLTREQIQEFLLAVGRRYEQSAQHLIQTEEELQRERGEDFETSQRKERAVSEGYTLLLDLKDAIRGVYGADILKHLQLHGRTRSSTAAVLQSLQHIENWMLDPAQTFPSQTRSFVQPLAKTTILKELQPALRRLEDVLHSSAKEERETESSVYAKNQAIDDFDNTHQQTIHILLGLLEMAGLDNEAERLQPKIIQRRTNPTQPTPSAA